MSRSRYGRSNEDVDESVYNLIPEPEYNSEKAPVHKSIYPPNVPPTGSTFGAASTTAVNAANLRGDIQMPQQATHRHVKPFSEFGPKVSEMPDPNKFLPAHSTKQLPLPNKHSYNDTRKPKLDTTFSANSPVKLAQTSRLQQSTNRNYIAANALTAILSTPKQYGQQSVDYLHKADYGKVPQYLDKVKDEIVAEKVYIQTLLNAENEEKQRNSPKTSLLPEEERLRLLDQLKSQWELVNKNYQTFTHITTLDSTGKIKRKEEYEIQLGEIEKSIEKLSKKNVFVQHY